VQNMLDVFRRIDKATDIFITLSPWYKKVMLDNGFDPRKVKIIQAAPGRPPLHPLTGDRPPIPRSNGLKIVFAGRQSYEKGFHLLLTALASLPPARLQLFLFGKITEPAFEAEIASLRSKGYDIRQHGEIPHDELLGQLEEMDIFCLPSTSVEMSPLVIPESFSMGIPVIGSRQGGIADAIIDGKNGLTFTSSNAADLASKIDRLLQEPELLERMKKECAASYRENDIGPLHRNLYTKLITENGISQSSSR
jgi:glycosyltransferase involved in cell wall biosynthesis